MTEEFKGFGRLATALPSDTAEGERSVSRADTTTAALADAPPVGRRRVSGPCADPRAAVRPHGRRAGVLRRASRGQPLPCHGKAYQAAFLTTCDGVVLFDAPPTIGHNLQRAVNEIAAANGVSNKVTHLIYSHHHADHAGASSLFDRNVTRIGHEETRKLLLRDDDPARPPPEETLQDRRTTSQRTGST